MLNVRPKERGSALMISLGVLVLLALMGTMFVMQARLESRAALAASNLAQVEQLTLQRLNTLIRSQGLGGSIPTYSGGVVQKGEASYNVGFVDNDNNGYADSNWTHPPTQLSKYDLGADTVERYVRYAILKKVISQNLIDVNSHSPTAIKDALVAATMDAAKAGVVATNIISVELNAATPARYGTDTEPGAIATDDNSDGIDDNPPEFQPLFPYGDDKPFDVTTLVDILVNPADTNSRLARILDNNNADFEPHRQLFTSYSVTKVTPEGKAGLAQVNLNDLVAWIVSYAFGNTIDLTTIVPPTLSYNAIDFSGVTAPAGVTLPQMAEQALLKFRDTMGRALGGSISDLARANQITVNLKDFLDDDQDITRLTVDTDSHYYGIEKHPYINEAWIWNRLTDGKDNDGANGIDDAAELDYYFVELYNPWDVAIDLDDWRIGGGDGASAGTIGGSIPTDGYLVLTSMTLAQGKPAACVHVTGLSFDPASGTTYNQGGEINLYWEDTYASPPADPYVLVDRFRFPIQTPAAALLPSAERAVFMIDWSEERASGTSMALTPNEPNGDGLTGSGSGAQNDNYDEDDVIDLFIADSTSFRFENVGELALLMEVGYSDGSLAYTQLGRDDAENDGDAETDEPHELWNNYRLNEGLNAQNDIDGDDNRRRICTLASDTRGVYEYFTTRPSFPNAKGEPGYTYGYVDICPPYNPQDKPVFCSVTNIVENNVAGSTYLAVDHLIDYGSGNTAGDVLAQIFADPAVINTYAPQTWGTLRLLEFGSDGEETDGDGLVDEKNEKELAIGALLDQVSGRPLMDGTKVLGVVAYIITCQVDNDAVLDDLVVYGQKRLLTVVDYTTSPVSIVCQKWLAPLR